MLCAVRFYIGHLVLTELYFLLTVEGLKMKLQKREREVESKKQELVSGDNSQIYRLTIQGTPTFSSKSKPLSNDLAN